MPISNVPSRNGRKHILGFSGDNGNPKSAKTAFSRKMSDVPRSTIEEDWNHHYVTLKEIGMGSFADLSTHEIYRPNRKKRRKMKKRAGGATSLMKNLMKSYG